MFKAGDIIAPVRSEHIPYPCWTGLEILGYNSYEKTATVKTKDGDIIKDFNLDPGFGEPFKVINNA